MEGECTEQLEWFTCHRFLGDSYIFIPFVVVGSFTHASINLLLVLRSGFLLHNSKAIYISEYL